MLTHGLKIFKCSLEDAALVAGCLKRVKLSMRDVDKMQDEHIYAYKMAHPCPSYDDDAIWQAWARSMDQYVNAQLYVQMPWAFTKDGTRLLGNPGTWWMWEDEQCGGGGVYLHWHRGIVWVSKHGGYGDNMDQTEQAAQLFRELGCPENYGARDPNGWDYIGLDANPRAYGINKCNELIDAGDIDFCYREISD